MLAHYVWNVFCMTALMNMAVVQNFEHVSDSFVYSKFVVLWFVFTVVLFY
jgi:hypothetical protein